MFHLQNYLMEFYETWYIEFRLEAAEHI